MTQPVTPFTGLAGLQVSASRHDDLPELIVDDGNLPATAQALAGILAAAPEVFERKGAIVKIVHKQDEIVIETLNAHAVVNEAHAVCRPVRHNGQRDKTPITLPHRLAQLLLNSEARQSFRPLRGITFAPLLKADGSIQSDIGYDNETGYWLACGQLRAISERPTEQEAQSSLRTIREVFSTFPFADASLLQSKQIVDLSAPPGQDESAFLVALMTALCRPSLAHTPALLVRAPQLSGSGTGKGLLVKALAQVAFGKRPKAFTSRGDRQELTKRIESALMQSEPIVFLDNINDETLVSNILAQAITEDEAHTRPLGRSQMAMLSGNAFIAVTGNAIRLSEDLVRRFLVVNLDAKCENPELRHFDERFDEKLAGARLDLLSALLTIWRWGRQNHLEPGIPLGNFDVWAAWCRDPLLALGCADPAWRIADLKDRDPLRQLTAEMFQVWHATHGPAPLKFNELDPSVRELLGSKPKVQVARLQKLAGTRAGGFSLEILKPPSRWGKDEYRVRREDQ